MDLLTDGIAQGVVQKTNGNRKLDFDGVAKDYPVYKIRLDQVRFNPQNDRIATSISKYKAEHGGQLPDDADVEVFNKLIEGFIEASNPKAIKSTRANIQLFGQREPGVVLSNGLLIDGNRRFTCLRQLASEDDRFNWIEAMILPESYGSDAKAIKKLELMIQFGQEAKVDYNPIDRLVGVYRDVVKERLLTEEEYARCANLTIKKVREYMNQAVLMAEFLDFANARDQFHLARDLEIAGPIQEIPNILKLCADADEQEDVKNILFANIIAEPEHDITRFVRKFKPILKSGDAQEFINEQKGLTAKVVDKLADMDEVTAKAISAEIRSDEALREEFSHSTQKADLKVKAAKVLSTFASNVESASELLEGIDESLASDARVTSEERARALRALDFIEKRVAEIREAIEAAEE